MTNFLISGDLKPNVEYFYKILIDDSPASPVYKFSMAFSKPQNTENSESKNENDVIKIGLVSDSQSGVIPFREHLDRIRGRNSHFLIHSGDVIQVRIHLEIFCLIFLILLI